MTAAAPEANAETDRFGRPKPIASGDRNQTAPRTAEGEPQATGSTE